MIRIWARRIIFTPILAYISPILYVTWGIMGGHEEASSVVKHMWKAIWSAEDLEHNPPPPGEKEE